MVSSIGRNPPSSSSSSSTAQNSPAQVHVVGKTVRLLFYTVYRIPVHRYSNARSRVYPRHRRLRPRPLSGPAALPPPPNPRNLTVFPDRLSSSSSSSSSSSPARRSSSTLHAFAVTPPEPRRRARRPRSSTVHRRQRNRTNVSVSPPSPCSRVFFEYSFHTSRKPIVPFTCRRYPFAYTTRPSARVSRAIPSALSGRVCVYVHVCACVPPSRYAHLCAGGDLNARPPAGNVRKQHATSGRSRAGRKRRKRVPPVHERSLRTRRRAEP